MSSPTHPYCPQITQIDADGFSLGFSASHEKEERQNRRAPSGSVGEKTGYDERSSSE
jgi:hypothetical protein